MKRIFLILTLFVYFYNYSQTAVYNQLTKEGEFKEYISKENRHIKIGDSIRIGLPYSANGFIFITQGSNTTTPNLSYRKIAVSKIKSIGKKKQGYKIYLEFKGFGLIPVLIDYEPAYYSNEIIFE